VVIIISTALSFFIALLLATDIVKPIRKLVTSMSGVKDGNFETNLSYKRNDEFAFLIKRYTTMMQEIKELIEKLYISELTKQKAEVKAREYEIKALQAQINPHFLYNTLDSINWLAIKYRAEDISIMVKSLSNFFRYSLNKGRNEIALEDEKKQIESYLMIQKIRFKEKLDFEVAFSPEILKCKTIKLILQPIVENAILHGIEKRKGKGFIGIIGSKVNDHIEIKISDNGVGANIEELNELLSGESDSETSFGIKNVNERIKQYFGERYGMTYYENQTGGVTAVFPYLLPSK
jgi:two-component system sensor histidine kinase YesM